VTGGHRAKRLDSKIRPVCLAHNDLSVKYRSYHRRGDLRDSITQETPNRLTPPDLQAEFA
jgi:hypothetical protein